MEEKEISIREICSLVNRLSAKVIELQNSVDILEAEVLAIGNLLVNKKIFTIKELDNYTSLVVKQKIAEKSTQRSGPIPALREEFEEALQNKIKQ